MHTSRACLRCDKPHRHAPRRAIEQIQGSVSRASSGWPILRIGEGQRQGIRRCLDTDDYGAASNRLPAVLAEIRGAKNASEAGTVGAAVNAEAISRANGASYPSLGQRPRKPSATAIEG